MKYLYITLLFIPLFVNAQQSENDFENQTFKLGIVPQYGIVNGTRLDLDFRLKNPKSWIVFAPQIYIHDQGTLQWDYDRMFGIGLEVQHKIFLVTQMDKRSAYIAYGPVFNYYSIKDNALTPVEFVEDEATYIGITDRVETTSLYKLGANLIIGIQYIVSERFYFDPYIGTGIRFSFDNKTSGLHKMYNEWWGDMGYSGTLIVGGIRFGVIF